jgi:ATP-dependent Clp protease protease subunit
MPKLIRSWFKMRAENGVGTINILGDIGGFGVNFESFNRALNDLGLGAKDEIKLTINSDGGDVYQGFAIYNALQMHPAKKTVTVMGLAASMASVIAMAGDVRRMPKNAAMMIHNPVGGISGNSEEIISFGQAVGDMTDNIAEAYVNASAGKLSKAKALALMDKQSWIGAEQALKLGLATEVIEPVKMAAAFIRASGLDSATSPLHPKRLHKESAMKNKPTADDAAMFEGEDTAAITEARADERKKILAQQSDVNALCRIARRPELAAKFNEDGKSVSDVMAELDKLGPATKSKVSPREGEVELNARQKVDTGDEGTPIIDSVAIYAQYNGAKERARTH